MGVGVGPVCDDNNDDNDDNDNRVTQKKAAPLQPCCLKIHFCPSFSGCKPFLQAIRNDVTEVKPQLADSLFWASNWRIICSWKTSVGNLTVRLFSSYDSKYIGKTESHSHMVDYIFRHHQK